MGRAAVGRAAPAPASGGSAHPSAPKLAQLGHATFWECLAKTTELLVAVNTLTVGLYLRPHFLTPVSKCCPSSAAARPALGSCRATW